MGTKRLLLSFLRGTCTVSVGESVSPYEAAPDLRDLRLDSSAYYSLPLSGVSFMRSTASA